MQQIRAMARQLDLKPGRSTKADLVRRIQRREGNFDCFGSAGLGICDQPHCLWRSDCFKQAARARGLDSRDTPSTITTDAAPVPD